MNSADKPSRGDALRARFDLHRGMAELAADLALALSVLLLLAVAFMAWQAWLIARQSQAAQALTQDKVQAVQKVAAALDLQRRKVDEALASPTLHQALASNDAAGRDRAAQLLRTALPQARAVMFYSADDILGASLQKLGYARAEQLTRALSSGAATPLEVRALPPQTLSFVQPVDDARGTALAYAAVELPFTRARAAYESIEMESGRLDLRQGDGSGDLVLATRGDQGLSTQDDAGLPIPHSRLRIAAAPPAYWLPVTQSLASALLLAVLAFVAGLGLLVARSRVRSRG